MASRVKPQRATVSAAPSSAPDSGYAWFVLLSCFLVFGLTFGVIKSFGVFYIEIHRYFETTATGTSWITSIAVATIHIVAPLGSALSARYGHRSVVVAGGLICSTGVITGAFARNLTELYLTVGFLNGFGYALTWTPTVTMVGLYFEERRPLANALASAGECVLTFVLTPLFQLLIDSFSWRGALLLLGGLQLNLCVCGILLRPLSGAARVTRASEANAEQGALGQGGPSVLREEEQSAIKETQSLEAPEGKSSISKTYRRTEVKNKILQYVDFTLITNARFMVYTMFGVFAALGFFAPALFLVPYARSQGVEEYQAATVMSISAALDLFGRVLFGWVANLRLMATVQQLIVTVAVLGAVLLLCPLASSFPELAAFGAAYGLAFGATVAVHITVLAEVVGVRRLGSALGFFMLIRSSGGLLGPPIAGYFIDKMNNYGAAFLLAGVSLIVSALFLLLLHQMNQKEKNVTTLETQYAGGPKGTEFQS